MIRRLGRTLVSAPFMRKPLSLLLATGTLAVAVTGCGTSRAPGVITAPSAGATADSTTPTVASSTTAASTSAAADLTPKSGPLSTQPTIGKPSGAAPKTLTIKNLVTGTGATATATDTVTVNYVGEVYKSGKIFDDHTWTEHENFTTPLSGVIPGWQKGVPGMKVGGRRELIIPPAEAYGKTAESGIPANSTLIFVIDLLKVTK
jgi:peptidylprolyl isomerase